MKMRKLNLHSLLLLSAMLATMVVGVANAQTTVPSMNTAINTLVPAQDPYCDGEYPSFTFDPTATTNPDDPHLCSRVPVGIAGDASAELVSVPFSVVDWVLLELRAVPNTNDQGAVDTDVADAVATTVVARKPGFLLGNGRVVDAEEYVALDIDLADAQGAVDTDKVAAHLAACTELVENASCPDVVFDQGDVQSLAAANDLYLVVRHRNHLDVISSEPIAETNGAYTHDFSSSADQARGGSAALKAKSDTFAMYAGDADGNGNVTLADYNTQILPNNGQATYLSSDTTMNANTDLGDYNNAVFTNNGFATQVP